MNNETIIAINFFVFECRQPIPLGLRVVRSGSYEYVEIPLQQPVEFEEKYDPYKARIEDRERIMLEQFRWSGETIRAGYGEKTNTLVYSHNIK